MKKPLLVFVLLITINGGYAREKEFPISTWFGVNSLTEQDAGWQTHWNNQKQKNFKNLDAAGFNATHAISARYGSGYPIYDSLLTLAISQEILDSAAVHGLQVELQHYFNIEPASHFQRIQIEVEKELKLPPGVNYEDINEVAFVIRQGQNFNLSGVEGKQLIPGIHNPGIVFQDARPVNKYMSYKYPKVLNVNPWASYTAYPNLFSNHYFMRCRLKIDPAGHPPTEPVITLKMRDLETGGQIVNVSTTFVVQDFTSQDFETKEIEADIPIDWNYPAAPEPEDESRGVLGDPRRYVYDMDFEVEWHGNVRIWVDWVTMDDEGAHKLFEGDLDEKIKNTAKTLNTHPALFNFYLFDEPWLKQLLTYDKINDLLEDAAIENGLDPSTGKGLARSAMQVDARGKQYYITNRLADPWAYYAGSDEYPLKS